ncbi:MAG: hypothetical protein ACF8R9_06740 [Phycisphaerales bacterium JB054]
MRIPVGRVYRAFPELDRFTDAQGEQFVRAACKRGWRRHLHRVLVVVFLLVSWVISWLLLMLGAYLLDRFAPRLDRSNAAFWTIGTLSILLFAAPIVLMLPVKDWFLLRRLRLVIRARGTCPSCQYSLLGAMVDDRDHVICPECGMGLEADASLDEIATDDAGRKVFMPSGRHKSLEFWTPRRRRIGKRLAIAAAVLVFAVLPTSWGGYEVFLRKQAATAAAERPGAAGILAFVEASQPVGSDAEENGWVALEEAAAAVDLVETDVLDGFSARGDTGRAYPDYSAVYAGVSDDLKGERLDEARLSLRMAEAVLAQLHDTGVAARLDALANHRRAVHEFNLPAGQPSVAILLPTLGDARQLARIDAARMHTAFEAGDREGFLAAFESGLAVARFCAQQFTLIEALVCDAITSLMHNRAQAAILQHPSADWLDGIEAAIARQTPRVRPSHRFEGEYLSTLDTIAWFFADPARARFGRFSPELNSIAGGFYSVSPFDGRLGTYAKNRDTYRAIVQPYIDNAGIEAAVRPVLPAPDTGGLLLIDLLGPAFNKTLQAMDHLHANTRATTTMIALERHYLDRGDYPESLDALVPRYLDALPLDPWTGEPFHYHHLPGAAVAPASYRLSSSGPDTVDDTNDPDPAPVKQSRPDDIVFSPPNN